MATPASIFTNNGRDAREFKYSVNAGNIGVNIGVAAPSASFPFGGQKDSFFGDLHGQGMVSIEFYTERKIVIERWGVTSMAASDTLNTFGAILTFAIELESRLAAYYESAGDAALAKAAEKRRKKLERTRRENVVEITLEPIAGLDAADYALGLGDETAAGQAAAAETAMRFYRDVAPKINVRAAQRTLERCGKEHARLAD